MHRRVIICLHDHPLALHVFQRAELGHEPSKGLFFVLCLIWLVIRLKQDAHDVLELRIGRAGNHMGQLVLVKSGCAGRAYFNHGFEQYDFAVEMIMDGGLCDLCIRSNFAQACCANNFKAEVKIASRLLTTYPPGV